MGNGEWVSIKKNIIFTKKEFILNDLKIYGIIDLR
jgi:hypothetical protein